MFEQIFKNVDNLLWKEAAAKMSCGRLTSDFDCHPKRTFYLKVNNEPTEKM